jgi:hypothetical protein
MKNNIDTYIFDLFTNQSKYIISPDEEKAILRDKGQFLIDKITRKKFRRHTLTSQTLSSVTEKIRNSVKKESPIHFVFPFGGYKHFWNLSHPEPDWAELFSLRYISDLVSPLLSAYEPGVIVEYMSEDLILNRMNNYPIKSLDLYSEIFSNLISWYKQYLPMNFDLRFFRVGDRVNKDELILEVERLIPERRKQFESLSAEQREQELHRSNRSIFWKGSKDLSLLSEKDRQQIIIDSRIIELAYYEVEAKSEYLGEYLSGDDHICLLTSFGTTHDNDIYQDLTIGSAHGSLVDFWIGRGILEKSKTGYHPRIVSKNQYEQFASTIRAEAVSGLLPYMNFQQIEVIDTK